MIESFRSGGGGVGSVSEYNVTTHTDYGLGNLSEGGMGAVYVLR